MNKNIIVFGLGYVGSSISVLLAQNNNVVAIDVVEEKINDINNKVSPIKDDTIQYFLNNKKLNLIADTFKEDYIKKGDYFFIATPTNFDEVTKKFDTSTVEGVINKIVNIKKDAKIIIKSTLPIGFTKNMRKKFKAKIYFSPEFLREGKALDDNLNPSRIIAGCDTKSKEDVLEANKIIELFKESCINQEVITLTMSNTEAESVKLFANSYLALRVSFFNELDTFAKKEFENKNVLSGICADPRIGDFYNNPSFGYGGYCLPKDTKQLHHEFARIPNSLIKSVINSNKKRKHFIANQIIKKSSNNDVIGIYKLNMKNNSDNCRQSAIFDVIKELSKVRKVVIFETSITEFENCEVENDFNKFISKCDIIVTNRVDEKIKKANKTIYTRDIFTRD